MKLKIVQKGGPGSGFHGHHGRPGEVGGSTSAAGTALTGILGEDLAKKPRAPMPSETGGKSTSVREIMETGGGFDDVKKGVPAYLERNYALVGQHARQPDVYTFGKTYYYTHGNTSEDFQNQLAKTMEESGFNFEPLYNDDHYYMGFVGGAGGFSAKNSFWFVVAKVTKK